MKSPISIAYHRQSERENFGITVPGASRHALSAASTPSHTFLQLARLERPSLEVTAPDRLRPLPPEAHRLPPPERTGTFKVLRNRYPAGPRRKTTEKTLGWRVPRRKSWAYNAVRRAQILFQDSAALFGSQP